MTLRLIDNALTTPALIDTKGIGMSNTNPQSGYAPVNGLMLYYEICGAGEPLIVLHGGFGSTGMFTQVLPTLAEGRQLIAADLQAHGRTADINRPLSLELMADDIAALIEHLGLERADIMGYSLGGGVALQAAIRPPELVRKFVVVSAPCKRSGWYPEMVAAMGQMGPEFAEMTKQAPMYQNYASIAPRPQDWPVLATKMGELLRQDYDFSEGVAALEMPVMIALGDADGLSPAHAVEFFGLLGGGKRDAGWDGAGMASARLGILPGTTHYDSLFSPMLVSVVTPFLDAPTTRG